jgi:MoaA/NifB/PqqE/SkfB family radical SAM enzyme
VLQSSRGVRARRMVKIFEASDNVREILDEILDSGVTGISGGRMAVRNKLREVAEMAKSKGHETVIANSTINHPDTELAYPYDKSQHGHKEARRLVEEEYDRQG